ncbi:MAG TPA: helix-turn-helix domain-containing protein [Candidatus Saccharibacteria bacterium]|nr:helix-turn-helix domain-containing protein [Candidatus Saccharibacteria bacterium]
MKEIDQTQLVLDILSSKWATRIVRTLNNNTRRFSEIQKALPDTKQKVLTETLRKLERNGIVDRKLYPAVPPQVEYKLTSIGLDFLQLSGVLSDWIAIHEEEIIRSQKSYDRRSKV